MAAIDGQFDKELNLEDTKTNVTVGGPLEGFEGLPVMLQVVVVDANNVVAEGTVELKDGPKPGPDGKPRWDGKAGVKDGSELTPGTAIAYATAVSAGPQGVKSWQWHKVVTLKGSSP
jgi:hypothetical protein